MVRDDFVALCAGSLMVVTWSGFGWLMAPAPAETKLAQIRAGVNMPIPRRTLRPDTKIVDCIMVWVGGPGGEPELWCPPAPPLPQEQAPEAVPTS
jgi:hypothetical protein